MSNPPGAAPEPPPSIVLDYKPGPDGGMRPFLWVNLIGPENTELIQGLIDTGADWSVLPLGYATLLGYEPSDLTVEQGTQVQGSLDLFRAAAPLEARLPGDDDGDFPFQLHPHFVDGGGMALLGRLDFMMAWSVFLEQPHSRFTLMWNGG